VIEELLIDALAAFRITRLVVADDITEPPRARVLQAVYAAGDREPPEAVTDGCTWTQAVHQDPAPPKLATLITCPWCAGFYVSIAVVIGRRLAPRMWRPVARAFALSGVAGIIGSQFE
jgi:hypothetical protein